MSHLVSAAALSELIAVEPRLRILDVRWRLDRPDGRSEFLEGHIPGAVYVDLDTELSREGAPDEGRHPIPSTDALQDAARRWGLHDGDVVVVYDDASGLPAARAWWLLRQGGVDVRVLDGGWRTWQGAGGAVETGERMPRPGRVTLTDVRTGGIDIDEAAMHPETGALLDVRAPERYRGEVEPMDPVAGHIPGAVNLPTTAHLREDGTLRSPDEIRAALTEAGIDQDAPIAAYCGSGVTAAHTALALAEAGIEAKIFHGSWSAWSNTPGRPVATG